MPAWVTDAFARMTDQAASNAGLRAGSKYSGNIQKSQMLSSQNDQVSLWFPDQSLTENPTSTILGTDPDQNHGTCPTSFWRKTFFRKDLLYVLRSKNWQNGVMNVASCRRHPVLSEKVNIDYLEPTRCNCILACRTFDMCCECSILLESN